MEIEKPFASELRRSRDSHSLNGDEIQLKVIFNTTVILPLFDKCSYLSHLHTWSPVNRLIWFTLGQKKVLFQEFGRVKIFLSPTRSHKSNVYENIYFLFQKNILAKFALANLFVRIYVFFPSNNKRWGSLFFKREKYCQSSFLSTNFVQIIQLNW